MPDGAMPDRSRTGGATKRKKARKGLGFFFWFMVVLGPATLALGAILHQIPASTSPVAKNAGGALVFFGVLFTGCLLWTAVPAIIGAALERGIDAMIRPFFDGARPATGGSAIDGSSASTSGMVDDREKIPGRSAKAIFLLAITLVALVVTYVGFMMWLHATFGGGGSAGLGACLMLGGVLVARGAGGIAVPIILEEWVGAPVLRLIEAIERGWKAVTSWALGRSLQDGDSPRNDNK